MNQRMKPLGEAINKHLGKIAGLRANPDYTEQAKRTWTEQLMGDRNKGIEAAVEDLNKTYERDIEALKSKAFAGSEPKSDNARLAHEMALHRHERFLTQKWQKDGPPTSADYAAAVESADVALMETYESLGPLYTDPRNRPELEEALSEGKRTRQIEGMSSSQRAAYDEMVKLQNEHELVKVNIPYQLPAVMEGSVELYDPTSDTPELIGAEG